MKVYLICEIGPEWSNPIEVHDDRKRAKDRCDELNRRLKEKKNKDVFEQLSAYSVIDVPFVKR